MVTTESFNSGRSKYSQLHTNVKHDHEHERKEHMRSRLQAHQQPHQEGLALCHRVALDSVAPRWVPARIPTVHWCPSSEGCGWPATTTTKTTNEKRPQDTDKRQDKRAFRKQVPTDTCNLTDLPFTCVFFQHVIADHHHACT